MNKQEILDKIKKNLKIADKLVIKSKKYQDEALSLLETNKELILEYQKNE